uniref:Dol-P-Glc:Glc(2)Man(9)GlcNAc(2)-PP-Dol alpha-1,2-glucosyltransferase n=1 Tax=Ditylenchus dipsaci TaxID=166011 RepID=A0A915E7W4_9BILA
MDEEFHVNQTRTYCSGNFFTWNSKITTPPALYLLALPCFCSRERYLNSILISFCYLGLCKLRRKWLPMSSSYENWLTPLIIVCLPVLLDTSFSVLHRYALPNHLGVLTRQTNVVWAGMYCLLAWLKAFDRTRPISSSLRSVMEHIPFVILAAGFVSFVYWNQGIVWGTDLLTNPYLMSCNSSTSWPSAQYPPYPYSSQKHYKGMVLFSISCSGLLNIPILYCEFNVCTQTIYCIILSVYLCLYHTGSPLRIQIFYCALRLVEVNCNRKKKDYFDARTGPESLYQFLSYVYISQNAVSVAHKPESKQRFMW